MKHRAAALSAILTLGLTLATPVGAQRTIDSLSNLKQKQAAELVEALTEKAQQDAKEAQERAQAAARESRRGRRSSNVQIRRGNTRELDQQQTGEGNFQSANIGTD
ncbi:MAG: hypothetical protein ACRBC3_03940 [Burkholderiaceae bacterium]